MFSLFFALIFTLNLASSEEIFKISNLSTFYLKEKSLNQGTRERVDAGEVYTRSLVEDYTVNEQKEQSLNFFITGIHAKGCEYALKKLSHYENYKNLVDFIKESRYDEKIGRVYFLLDSKLLPMKMSLSFNLPRIEKPGIYPFSFDAGIFTGLKGTIQAYEYKNKCLIFSEASWRGKHTGFPNIIVEMFSETLSKISMETMFRVTKI